MPECGTVSHEMRLDRQTGPVEALEDRTLTFGIEEVGIICVCWGGCLNEMHFKKMTQDVSLHKCLLFGCSYLVTIPDSYWARAERVVAF